MSVDVRARPEKIFEPEPDIIIDATGPFQANDKYSYRIPRLCLDSGVDYLDLSDDARFTTGISILDGEARKRGCRLLSGASSVPGLSSVVAAELCRDFDEVLLIDTAILPGNRAPRGASVIASIVGQLGKSSPVWRGGVWRDQRCWSERQRVSLAPDLVRTGYFIEVPDISLFPGFFGARSVMFRAGMELDLLNMSLRGLGALRRIWPFELNPGRVRFMQWCANLLLPFGTDRGSLGDRWSKLPPEVQDLHSVQDIESFSGAAQVLRGNSLHARFLAWIFRFPAAGDDVPVTVTKTRTDYGEIWERNFDGRILRSYCTPAKEPYCYRERFWLFNFELDLRVEDECMRVPVRRGWFACLPLPRFLLPRSDSREYSQNGSFRFDVALNAPFSGGLLVRYRGYLKPDRCEPLAVPTT